MTNTLVVAVILFAAVSAVGQTAEVDNWCRGGFFTRESDNFRIAAAVGKRNERVHFYNDFEDDCPGKESCRAKSYIVPGDSVVISRTHGEFGCAWFAPAKGSPTVGWLKLSSIKFAPPPKAPTLSAWLGEWRYAENNINFTNNKLAGWVNVTGDALWRGVGDNVHIGEIDDRAEPVGALLKVGERDSDEFACKATMRLMGEFLIVNDNLKCGGANVTFSGVYRKSGQ